MGAAVEVRRVVRAVELALEPLTLAPALLLVAFPGLVDDELVVSDHEGERAREFLFRPGEQVVADGGQVARHGVVGHTELGADLAHRLARHNALVDFGAAGRDLLVGQAWHRRGIGAV